MNRPPLAEVRAVSQPPSVMGRRSDEHWAGRWYMRGVSVRVTRLLIGTRITADAVTVAMLIVGVAGAAVVFVAGVWPAVAALVAVQAYLLLDCVDGEVARWRRSESARGIYLDRISHYLVEATLLAALGWRAGGGRSGGWALWGLVGSLAVVLARIETDLVDAARAKVGKETIGDRGETTRSGWLLLVRRVVRLVPLHRITGAVEASALILVAAIVDRSRGDLLASQWLLGATVTVAVAVAIGHLLAILVSDRLR